MKTFDIYDFTDAKWYNYPTCSLIPQIRKFGGAHLINKKRYKLNWLWFSLFLDNYGWGVNNAFSAWFSIDTPWFRFTIK